MADVWPPEGVVCGCQLTSPHQSTAHVASAKKTECSVSSRGCPGEMTGHPVTPTHPKRPSQGADAQEGELWPIWNMVGCRWRQKNPIYPSTLQRLH